MNEELKNKKCLVTGATGLIGQTLVKKLRTLDVKILAVVRNVEKARLLFGDDDKIDYIISDVTNLSVPKIELDYIIHAASVTSSKSFVLDPVGVSYTALEGTKNTLEIARVNSVKGYVFLSSMEVYGTPGTDEKIDELHFTDLNTMQPRSAYPESKRMCESLCASYASQFEVPAKVIRLTQTFGPGVQYNDGRVFAEFARCAIEGKDIILHTKGETKRSYLHTDDAAEAVLSVLVRGIKGEAYNAANEDTYCSIYEMAQFVANRIAHGRIKVIIQEDDTGMYGYAPTLHINLDTAKLRKLGWKPRHDLEDMFVSMCESMTQNHR